MAKQYDFGLIGLGVMGRNLILNIADSGFSALGLTSSEEKVKLLKEEGKGVDIDGTIGKEDFIARLSQPRKIMMMVPAGDPVDSMIEQLLPLLEEGDVLIDGGNSYFEDTDRREKYLHEKGVYYFGAGVSGGAKGARFGPSIMPGGDRKAYELIKPIFEAAAAKVDGSPCVDYMGDRSAGNYVKMIHNGIEYGLMQLISEIYDIMHRGMGISNRVLSDTFDDWNKGKLQSFLIEITAEIFKVKDGESNAELVDMILDRAKQKGTGKWTSQNAMDLGIPIPSIDTAVSMREISAMKSQRIEAEKIYPKTESNGASELSISDLENALYFAFIVTYSQGMSQLAAASIEYDYNLDMEKISKIWRGGCIIRAALLEDMRQAYDNNPELTSLLLDGSFSNKIKACEQSARKVVLYAIEKGIPSMSLSASLNYFDSFVSGRLPLNLIQAQRDHFGSHTYERIDKEGIFHTEW